MNRTDFYQTIKKICRGFLPAFILTAATFTVSVANGKASTDSAPKKTEKRVTARMLEKARLAANKGDYTGSSRMYRAAMAAGADSLVCLQALADNAMHTGDYEYLLQICPQVRELDDWMPYTYNYEAQANAALGNIDSAVNNVVELVYLVGIDNDSYEAMTAVADKNLNAMANRFRAEKTADETNALWDECLGTIFLYARLYDQAADAFLNALKLNPDSDENMETLALLYNQMRMYDEALHYATKAIAMNPAATNYVSNKAVILRNAGRSHEAIQMLTDALADSTECAAYYADRGMLLACTGNYAAAVEDYDRALQADAPSAATLLRKGIALQRSGNATEAKKIFRSVVALGHTRWSGTALAQAYLGNTKAVDSYIRYATERRQRMNNYFSLAAICDVAGRPRQALQYIEMALKDNQLNPDVIAYDQSLQKVKDLPGYKTLMDTYGITEK